jgi:hypothetical protein
MKTLIIEPEFMGKIEIEEAFKMIFDEEIVKKAHKYSHIEVGKWDNENKRTVVCKMVFDIIPKQVQEILNQNSLSVNIDQNFIKFTSPERWEINNNLKFNFPGARYFKIKPFYYLQKNETGVYFGGRVENSVFLPAPVKSIVEKFIQNESEKQIINYKKIILESLQK